MNTGKINSVRRMGDLGRTRSTHQEEGKHRALGEEMRRKNLLRSSGIERKTILKLFLQKYNISVWSGLIRPRPRICAWVLEI
jgi:hypothetical protein